VVFSPIAWIRENSRSDCGKHSGNHSRREADRKGYDCQSAGANENFLERSVLLVVPASIVSAKICLFFSPSSYLGLQLYQWYSELDKHGGDSLGIVKIYKSSENKHMTIKQLTKHNTVLASYAEVTIVALDHATDEFG